MIFINPQYFRLQESRGFRIYFDLIIFRSIVAVAVVLASLPKVCCFSQESRWEREMAEVSARSKTDRAIGYLNLFFSGLPTTSQREEFLEEVRADFSRNTSSKLEQAVLLVCTGRLRSTEADYAAALEAFAGALPLAESCKESHPIVLFRLLTSRSWAYCCESKWNEAEADSKAAVELALKSSSDLPLQRAYRLLGLVASRVEKLTTAVEFHVKELEYGMSKKQPFICASAIQKIVGILQHSGGVTPEEVNIWLEKGEQYLKQAANPRLDVLYACRKARLAIDYEDKPREALARFVRLIDENIAKFKNAEKASLYLSASAYYMLLDDLEQAYNYAKAARKCAAGSFAIVRAEIMLASVELRRNESENAQKRLKSIKDSIHGLKQSAEWHYLYSSVCQQNNRLDEAVEHLAKSHQIRLQWQGGAVSAQLAGLERLNELRDARCSWRWPRRQANFKPRGPI